MPPSEELIELARRRLETKEGLRRRHLFVTGSWQSSFGQRVSSTPMVFDRPYCRLKVPTESCLRRLQPPVGYWDSGSYACRRVLFGGSFGLSGLKGERWARRTLHCDTSPNA